jgi:hypothetical protein
MASATQVQVLRFFYLIRVLKSAGLDDIFAGLVVFFGAFGTKAGKLQIVANDFKYGGLVELVFDLIQRGDGCIIHAVAVDAPNVIMFMRNAVITLERSTQV